MRRLPGAARDPLVAINIRNCYNETDILSAFWDYSVSSRGKGRSRGVLIMVLEVESRDKQYALDVVNVILCDLKLEGDPYFKIRNHRLWWMVYFAVTAICFVASLLLSILYRSLPLGICSAVFGFCAVHAYGYIYSSARIMKDLLGRGRLTYTFGKEGVECDNHEKQKMSFQWDYFRYIKLYGTGMFFIPKKKAASILAVPVSYEKEVRSFLRENEIPLDFFV